MLVLGHRRFGTTYPSQLEGFKQSKKEDSNYISSCALDMRTNAKTIPAKHPLFLVGFNKKIGMYKIISENTSNVKF
jgi:hypothetical protein